MDEFEIKWENALKLLKENGYIIKEHEGWGGYTVIDSNGEEQNYGTAWEQDEVIEFVNEYLGDV